MDVDTGAVEAIVRARPGDTLSAVTDRADAIAAAWEGRAIDEAEALTDALEHRLEDCEADLLEILETAVDSAGRSLPAEPVSAPPYLTVTSRGPVLRGTVADGRLVVVVPVFCVTGEGRYERTAAEKPLTVEWYPDERSRP